MAMMDLRSVAAESSTTFPVYGIGIFLATASFLVMLLVIPPMCWHFRNRNIGATFFIGWVVALLFFSFVNELLWGSDDIDAWYDGAGLCDVEVKLIVASQVGFPAAFCCVLRALAVVMDTNRVVVLYTDAEKRRKALVELFVCIFPALLQMPLHFIVQPNRYYVVGISGCVASADHSWLEMFLMEVIPAIWLLVDAYYALIILVRLYRYRLNFNAILASRNTTKSRFLRLYLICIIWIVASSVIWAYNFWWNRSLSLQTFDWAQVHNPATWNQIIMIPSQGQVVYAQWIWLTTGVLVFVFFGLGRDALRMYRSGLLALGFGRIVPSLNPEHRDRDGQSEGTQSTLLKKFWNTMSTTSSSSSSQPTATSISTSPVQAAYFESIDDRVRCEDDRTTTSNALHSTPADEPSAAQTYGSTGESRYNPGRDTSYALNVSNHAPATNARVAADLSRPGEAEAVIDEKAVMVHKEITVVSEKLGTDHDWC